MLCLIITKFCECNFHSFKKLNSYFSFKIFMTLILIFMFIFSLIFYFSNSCCSLQCPMWYVCVVLGRVVSLLIVSFRLPQAGAASCHNKQTYRLFTQKHFHRQRLYILTKIKPLHFSMLLPLILNKILYV